MFQLKRFIKNVSSIRVPADWYNTVSNMLEGLSIKPSIDETPYIEKPTQNGEGWTIHLPLPRIVDYAEKHSFDLVLKTVTLNEKPVLTVKEGYFTKHGSASIKIAEKDHELEKTAPLTYIYIEADETNSIYTTLSQVAGTRPQTVAGVWRKVLYEISTVNGMPTVDWDRRHDFDLGSPI